MPIELTVAIIAGLAGIGGSSLAQIIGGLLTAKLDKARHKRELDRQFNHSKRDVCARVIQCAAVLEGMNTDRHLADSVPSEDRVKYRHAWIDYSLACAELALMMTGLEDEVVNLTTALSLMDEEENGALSSDEFFDKLAASATASQALTTKMRSLIGTDRSALTK